MEEIKKDDSLALTLVKEYAAQTNKVTKILILSIVINLLIVIVFLVFISQYEIEMTDIQQGGYGINNYIGRDGDNTSGTENTYYQDEEKE